MKQVLVLRALMLGDLLCATPALRALRAALPDARISLLGLPWARTLVERLDSVDEFVEFPGWPGLPEREVDAQLSTRIWADLRARRFDLALQLHGSGQIVNQMLSQVGARRNAGFCTPDSWQPAQDAERFIAWPEHGSEVERLLALTDSLDMPRQGLALDFPLVEDDRRAAQRLLGRCGMRAFTVIHPGSQLPSRRWPPARFAAVADVLAALGQGIVLTGSESEKPLTAAVQAAMTSGARALDLAGQTNLWSLGGVIERAALLVSNDTGVSHIAAGLRRPSVVVASGSEVVRWKPTNVALHHVLWENRACRPCTERICPHAIDGHSACAAAVDASSVSRAALRLLDAQTAPEHSRQSQLAHHV